MRPALAFLSLSSLLLFGQEDDLLDILPALPPPPEALPDLPTAGTDNDPLADIFGAADRPAFSLPGKVKITGSSPQLKLTDGNWIATYPDSIKLIGDNGLQAFADRAVYDSSKGEISLTGNVTIYQGDLVYRSESSVYSIQEERFRTEDLRTGLEPILLEAGALENVTTDDGRDAYVGKQARITTHDVKNPDFWIQADRITVFPGDKVVLDEPRLRAGDRTLFWLPYLSQPFDARLGFAAIPGSRSNLGAFLKTRYGVLLGGQRDPETGENKDAWLLAQYRAEAYTLRGLGLGVDLLDTRVDSGDQFGWLKLFYIHDFNSSESRAGVSRGDVVDDRFRIDFAHRLGLWQSETATYNFEANLTLLSDEFFLEDFDPSRFRIDNSPDNYLAFTRRTASSLATLNARLRLNSFYQSTTQLPELTYDWIRQPFLDSDFLYESQTSLGFYNEEVDRFSENGIREQLADLDPSDPRFAETERLLLDRSHARFRTYHEFSHPTRLGKFTLVPRLGAGYTRYDSIRGSLDSLDRTSIFAGLDLSTKFTADYPSWANERWGLGLNTVRHIIQPYANISYLATDELDSSFLPIDRVTASTRPRTLGLGRFAGVDELRDWTILRSGVRNRILTQRNGETLDWLSINTFFDTFFEDPEFNRSFSNLYNEITWNPLPWFSLDLETQFPLFNDSNFTEVAGGLRFLPTKNVELDIEFRHLKNHPILRDSNLISFETYTRLNEEWGLGTFHRFEFEDSTLELQRYELHHDFDSFVASIGVFHRNNRVEDEFGISFGFGLKEIPSLSLPISIGTE